MTAHTFVKKVKCNNCQHEFNMNFISSNGEYVDRVDPDTCPNCGNNKFVGRFEAIGSNWIGTYGSNK